MTKHIRDSKLLRGLLLGSVAFGLAVPAHADTEADIQAQLDHLKQQVEALKNERAAQPAPANAVTGGDFPGSFKLPGTDTSIAIGGYVKGDIIGNLDHDLGDTFAVDFIPVDGTRDTGSTRMHARQSRLNFDFRTPTVFGEARGYVEGDFFGGGGNEVFSNSTSMRLRHAYAELGPVLVGQTWTLFMPLTSYPWSVDFHGPVGIPFLRQGQARYTQDLGGGLSIAGSIENGELFAQSYRRESLGSRSSGSIRAGIDKLPDFVGALQYDRDGWHFKLSGVARLLSVEDIELTDGTLTDDDEFGWGIMGAAAIPIAPSTQFNVNLTYGDGVGRYLFGAFAEGTDAFLDDRGNLESIETWGLATSIMHSWNDEFTSNIVYGRHELQDTFFDDTTETLQSVHVNTFYSPVPKVTFGLEYMHGRRDFVDSSLDNTANRIQASAQYSF